MEVKKISIREAKKRIKNDPELSKMLVRSGWREIALKSRKKDRYDRGRSERKRRV